MRQGPHAGYEVGLSCYKYCRKQTFIESTELAIEATNSFVPGYKLRLSLVPRVSQQNTYFISPLIATTYHVTLRQNTNETEMFIIQNCDLSPVFKFKFGPNQGSSRLLNKHNFLHSSISPLWDVISLMDYELIRFTNPQRLYIFNRFRYALVVDGMITFKT